MPLERRRKHGPFAVDVDKYYAILFGGRPKLSKRLTMWLLNSDFHCVVCFRYSQWARGLYGRNRVVGLLPVVVAVLWRRWVSTIHHVYIDGRAQIGRGFLIMHRSGIFIGPVVIGENCVLHHNVTMGMRVAESDVSVPTLGDNVWIGPGATITGGVTVGDNVTISAGAVLSKDVPANSLVAGNPGRVIQSDYDNSGLINYRCPEEVLPPAS